MSHNVVTSLAPVSGFLLDMDPIKVSREPDELKIKSHLIPVYIVFTIHTFHKRIFSLVLSLLDVTKLSKLETHSWVEVPGVSSELWRGWSQYMILFCISLLACILYCIWRGNVCHYLYTLCILFKKLGESTNWLVVYQMYALCFFCSTCLLYRVQIHCVFIMVIILIRGNFPPFWGSLAGVFTRASG